MIFPPKIIKQKNKNTSRRKAQKKINCQLLGNVLHPRSERETEGINHTFQQQTLSTFAFFSVRFTPHSFLVLAHKTRTTASAQKWQIIRAYRTQNNEALELERKTNENAEKSDSRKDFKFTFIYFFLFCYHWKIISRFAFLVSFVDLPSRKAKSITKIAFLQVSSGDAWNFAAH